MTTSFARRTAGVGMLAAAMIVAAGCAGGDKPAGTTSETVTAPPTSTTSPARTTTSPVPIVTGTPVPCADDPCVSPTHGAGLDPANPPPPGPAPSG